MNGAHQYALLFPTGQHGRLYFVSGVHARGRSFRIFLLPKGEVAIPNGENNAPLNADSVEIYGIVSGEPGWNESYGWIHATGAWVEDFNRLVMATLDAIAGKRELEKNNPAG